MGGSGGWEGLEMEESSAAECGQSFGTRSVGIGEVLGCLGVHPLRCQTSIPLLHGDVKGSPLFRSDLRVVEEEVQ